MNTSTIIILVIVIAIAALALKGSIGHFKGEGGCCDTGGGTLPDNKELQGAKIGEKRQNRREDSPHRRHALRELQEPG